MAIEGAAGTLGFVDRIDVQDEPGNLLPVRALGCCIQKAEIGHSMFFIIGCQNGISRREVGDSRIERRNGHWSEPVRSEYNLST